MQLCELVCCENGRTYKDCREENFCNTFTKNGISTLQISKVQKRDHRAVRKASEHVLYKLNKGKRFLSQAPKTKEITI